jgi:isoleucyl-tRNA synthetase
MAGKDAPKEPKDGKSKGKYADSVRLPETAFPMRGDLAIREPELIARWQQDRLYQRIGAARAGAPRFVLHDGPPYSNGSIHYGHILNKILKDMVVRSKTMAGFDAPYIPGWDTHGLPIELAVERELKDKRSGMTSADVRAACEAYARKYVAIQRTEFERLGILGQWDEPYLTLDHEYEQAIVTALAAFTRGGYLYRGKKPVYWCPRDRTALAEAEIEYKDKSSPSIYVRLPLEAGGAALDPRLGTLALVIWTTTPWTLPANLAVVAHPRFTYVAIPRPGHGEHLLVAKELAEKFCAAVGLPCEPATWIGLGPDQMRTLEGARYRHPFMGAPRADADYRLWFAEYVTAEAGTGLVHTAPGHGADDYGTGVAHGLEVYAPVDDAGRFTAEVPHWAGLKTDEANPLIAQFLADAGALLNAVGDKIQHSFPHCWRCKNPILFRATPQWFIKMDHPEGEGSLRTRALAAIRATEWVPPWGENRIYAMIENRPDWVLSRQRLWGTPIPAFYCRACNREHADADTMTHIAAIFGREGADAWWKREVADLLPAGTRCAGCGADGATAFEREKDIVDVWFESGVSWLAMAAKHASHADRGDGLPPIDLYLEGSDQHRGWFHSSLLVGIGLTGLPPYREVITHGFVLDENGIPYSKSTIQKAKAEGKKTSYIEPEDVIKKSGAEMFRLWVASIEFRNDMPYSQAILDGLAEWYRKFRNSARFVLGNLTDFDPNTHTRATVALRPIDRYLLARKDDLVARCTAAFAAYEFHVVHRALVDFVTIELSALYSDVVKDSLYTDAADGPRRRAAQVVLYEIVHALATLSAPIMCFTAEDIWQHLPRKAGDPDSVHLAPFPTGLARAAQEAEALWTGWDQLLALRGVVTKELEPFRAQKHKSTDARIEVGADRAALAALGVTEDDLAELFVVSAVTIRQAPGCAVHDHGGLRCERCWKWFPALAAEPNDVCVRCAGALAALRG